MLLNLITSRCRFDLNVMLAHTYGTLTGPPVKILIS